jgi:hypothetical protein
MFGRFKPPIWIFPVVIAGMVAVFGWWGNQQLRSTIRGSLDAQLRATLTANVTALGIWSTNQIRLATVLAEDPGVARPAAAILQSPPRRRDTPPTPELESFVSELRPRLGQLGYGVGQLVTTNLMVVANSTRPQWIINNMVSDAHTNQFAELFATGKPVIITPFRPELLTQRRAGQARTNGIFRPFNPRAQTFALRRGDNAFRRVALMQVAAPVCDDDRHIVGALALIINPDLEFSRILSVARSGRSGETYAFDQTGLMISHSRFDKQLKQLGLLEQTNDSSALNLRLHDPGGDLTKGYQPKEVEGERPLIRLVASAVDGENMIKVEVNPSRDYRGVPVVGASCWLPEFGFGVATQINAEEAYRPLRVLQLVFVVLVLFLLLCATGLFVFSYANLAWRQRLNAAELKLKQLGQYTLEEKLGEGGMGVVYRARHAMLRRDTAVKLLLPGRADEGAVARFEREVCLTCQLTHPNTIQVYDYGHTPEGIFYYAMEYLRGLNLHDLVAQFGPQPEGRVVHIMAQICDSLAEAHDLGLIHRDIKPGNVFLCRRGGMADCVKVLDFGLVRQFRAPGAANAGTDAESGVEGVAEGTPWFMPPEAVQDSVAIDPRSDLYSLGALGYYLLTGYFIFDAQTVVEIHEKTLTSAPVPLRERTSNPVSVEMEQLLLRCLEKDMQRRPNSAGELRALLLATPAAGDWTPEARAAWWDANERRPVAEPEGTLADLPSPMPTVRVDLSSRME